MAGCTTNESRAERGEGWQCEPECVSGMDGDAEWPRGECGGGCDVCEIGGVGGGREGE